MSLGAELRQARLDAGLTQERLAVAAGVDRAYVSQLENDHKSPTVTVLYLLCDAIGVTASELLARFERTRNPRSVGQSGRAEQGSPPGEE